MDYSITEDHVNNATEGINIVKRVKNSYGLSLNVEIYFSGIKRLFGEVIRAVKVENIIQEMMLKVYFYNEYNKLRGCKIIQWITRLANFYYPKRLILI